MLDWSLALIRILRRIPHTDAFDRHLTDCAAHAVLYRDDDLRLPRLTWRHVLRLDALPPPYLPTTPRLVADG